MALFHYLEASRVAYAYRDAYVGDPHFVTSPPGCSISLRRDPPLSHP